MNLIASEVAPKGVLRVGINLSNFLLVSGRQRNGDPKGIAPDLAAEIARDLDIKARYICFDTPQEVADSAVKQLWDIAFIGHEPERGRLINFTAAYIHIDATYLVFEESNIRNILDIDRVGISVAVAGGTAYDLYLTRTLKNARLVRADGLDGAYELFSREKLDALAGLRPALLGNLKTRHNARILDGGFTIVRQAIGVPGERVAGHDYLCDYIEDAKASGLISRLISKHDVKGVVVAPCL